MQLQHNAIADPDDLPGVLDVKLSANGYRRPLGAPSATAGLVAYAPAAQAGWEPGGDWEMECEKVLLVLHYEAPAHSLKFVRRGSCPPRAPHPGAGHQPGDQQLPVGLEGGWSRRDGPTT